MDEVLPLQAPMIALARLFVKPDPAKGFLGYTKKYRESIKLETATFSVSDGWRCDSTEREREYVMLDGWQSKEQHVEWRTKHNKESSEPVDFKDYILGTDVVYLRNIER